MEKLCIKSTFCALLGALLILTSVQAKAFQQGAPVPNPRAPVDISSLLIEQDPGISDFEDLQGLQVRDVNDAGWVYGHYTSPLGGSTRLFVITTDSTYNLDSLIIIDDVQGARAVDLANNGNVVYNRYNPATGDPEGILRVFTEGVGYGGPERAVKFVDNSWANAVEGQYSAGKVYMFEERPDFGLNVPLIGWIPLTDYLIFEDYWRGQIKKNEPGFGDSFIDFGTSLAFYYNRWSEVFDVRSDGSAAGYTYASEQGPYLNNPVPLVRYFDDDAAAFRFGTVLNGEIGEARKVNALGEVAGYWWESQGNQSLNGFFSNLGCTNIFGEFKWKDILPGRGVTVRGLNNSPFVVGSYPTEKAYVWKPCDCDEQGRFYDLTTLVTAQYDSLDWKYETAWGLNNANYVVGRAQDETGREFPYRVRIPLCINCPDIEVVGNFPKKWRSDKPFDFDSYVDVTAGSELDIDEIQWYVEDKRTGALNPVPEDERNEYYFNTEGRDEWGRVRIVAGTGENSACLEFGNDFYIEVLDWGLYFLSNGPEMEKWREDDPDNNAYYTTSKPTIIFTHGWRFGKAGAHERENLKDPEGNHLAQLWRDKGYNVGVFYWTQFADDNPIFTEFKVYNPSIYGLTWRKERDNLVFLTSADEVSPDSSITDLFLADFRRWSDAGGRNKPIRFAGHGYGAQLVANAARLSPGIERPYRITLLDPVYTPTAISDPLDIPNYIVDKIEDYAARADPNIAFSIDQIQDAVNDWVGEPFVPRQQFSTNLQFLNGQDVALEWYETSIASFVADFLDVLPELINLTLEVVKLIGTGGASAAAGVRIAGVPPDQFGTSRLATDQATQVAPGFAPTQAPQPVLPLPAPDLEGLTLVEQAEVMERFELLFKEENGGFITVDEADAVEVGENVFLNWLAQYSNLTEAQKATNAAKLAAFLKQAKSWFKIIIAFVDVLKELNEQATLKRQAAFVKLNIADATYLGVVPDPFEQHRSVLDWYFKSIVDTNDEQPEMVRYAAFWQHYMGTADVSGDYMISYNYRGIKGLNAASCDERVKAFKGLLIGQVGGSHSIESNDDLFLFQADILPQRFEDTDPNALCCEEGTDIAVTNLLEYPQDGDTLLNEPFDFEIDVTQYDLNDTRIFVGKPDKIKPNKTRWFEVTDIDKKYWFEPKYLDSWSLENRDSVYAPYGKWKIKAESTCEESTVLQEIEVEVLDWGLYFKQDDGKLKKYVPTYQENILNPNRRTMVYVHGFQGGSVSKDFFDDLNALGQNFSSTWKQGQDKWNVGIWSWVQFADASLVTSAQDKIHKVFEEGMPWRVSDGSFSNLLSPKDASMAQTLAKDLDLIRDKIGENRELRVVGHSLGTQMAIEGSFEMTERFSNRVALLDPYWHTQERADTLLYMMDSLQHPIKVENEVGSDIENEEDNGFADENTDPVVGYEYTYFEWYQATNFDQVGETPLPIRFFPNKQHKRRAAFVRLSTDFMAEEFEEPAIDVDLISQFLGTNYLIDPRSAHVVPVYYYFNAFGQQLPVVLLQNELIMRMGGYEAALPVEQWPALNVNEYPPGADEYWEWSFNGISSADCNRYVDGFNGYVTEQIGGNETISPADDFFKTIYIWDVLRDDVEAIIDLFGDGGE